MAYPPSYTYWCRSRKLLELPLLVQSLAKVCLHQLCLQIWFVLLVTVPDIHKLSIPPRFPVLLWNIFFHSPHILLLLYKCISLTLDHLHRPLFHISSFQSCTLHLLLGKNKPEFPILRY